VSSKRALVLGGSGAVGQAVVRALVAADVPTTFTYFQGGDRAQALTAETGAEAAQVDLTDAAALEGFLAGLDATPNVLVHCAATAAVAPLAEISASSWDQAHALNCRSALLACQRLAPGMREAGGGEIVLLGGMDRTQSLPIPVTYAATQGALSALTMALAKELGPLGVRINMLAVGLLEGGLSDQLRPELVRDYEAFSALQRRGSAEEITPAVLWLALRNTYLSGRVVQVNGGL
jgi:3-oxoacyl-[acyl-carrier protein] reductase